MKRFAITMAITMLVLASCTIQMPGNPETSTGTEDENSSVSEGLPSWLAGKTWRGELTATTEGEEQHNTYQIIATAEDLYIPIEGTTDSLGIKESLESQNVNYSESTTSDSYRIIVPEYTAVYEYPEIGEVVCLNSETITINKLTETTIRYLQEMSIFITTTEGDILTDRLIKLEGVLSLGL